MRLNSEACTWNIICNNSKRLKFKGQFVMKCTGPEISCLNTGLFYFYMGSGRTCWQGKKQNQVPVCTMASSVISYSVSYHHLTQPTHLHEIFLISLQLHCFILNCFCWCLLYPNFKSALCIGSLLVTCQYWALEIWIVCEMCCKIKYTLDFEALIWKKTAQFWSLSIGSEALVHVEIF